jgi:hypothetical protein
VLRFRDGRQLESEVVIHTHTMNAGSPYCFYQEPHPGWRRARAIQHAVQQACTGAAVIYLHAEGDPSRELELHFALLNSNVYLCHLRNLARIPMRCETMVWECDMPLPGYFFRCIIPWLQLSNAPMLAVFCEFAPLWAYQHPFRVDE